MGDEVVTEIILLDQRDPEFWDGVDPNDALLLQVDAKKEGDEVWWGRIFLPLSQVNDHLKCLGFHIVPVAED